MSNLNSFVLCSIDDVSIKAYSDWTLSARNCNDNQILTTCDGIRIHFDIDGFLDLGIILNPYMKQRLTEALCSDGLHLNKVSKYCIQVLQDSDPEKLRRWESSCQGFNPNYVTINGTGNIVYAKGSTIDIILDCCIKITPTMWIEMSPIDRECAKCHNNFKECTSEWSEIFKLTHGF